MQEGFEADIYDLAQAKAKISEYDITIGKTEKTIEQPLASQPTPRQTNTTALMEELTALHNRNLDQATFEQKLDIVNKLAIQVYPSEDLKSMKVTYQLGNRAEPPKAADPKNMTYGEREHSGECAKDLSGSPGREPYGATFIHHPASRIFGICSSQPFTRAKGATA